MLRDDDVCRQIEDVVPRDILSAHMPYNGVEYHFPENTVGFVRKSINGDIASGDVTLRKYVTDIMKPQTLDMMGNETFYWFGDNNYTEWEELFNAYSPPPYRLPHMTGVYSFGLAGAGTGVPFHFHGPGFGEVVFGRKRWFLYPPDQQPSFDPNKTTLHWLIEEYPHLPPTKLPLECTINKGELIYFPDRWWHGTLNIDTSVFISTFLGPS